MQILLFVYCLYICVCVCVRAFSWLICLFFTQIFSFMCVTLFTLFCICIINKYKNCRTCKPTRSAQNPVPSDLRRAIRFDVCAFFPPRFPAYCRQGSFRSLSRSHPLTSFSSVLLPIFLVLYKHIIFITVIRLDLRLHSDHLP